MRGPVTIRGAGAFIWMVRLRGLATDAQLLAATDSDPEAFARFYRRHEQVVIGYLMRRLRDPEAAADLTAEVFAAALDAASRYRPTGETAVPWLLTIAHNTLISSLRRGQVEDVARRRVGMLEVIELRSESMRQVEQTIAGDAWVSDLLARLPEDQREAVRARVLDERSYEDIAAELQTSSLVVRKRVSRGLARLRSDLEERS
jgi:RNA polymerase sigma factor (sigma-70 family)